MKRKKRIFEILELATAGDTSSRIFDIFIITLIILNVIAVILQSMKSLDSRYAQLFWRFEIFSIAVFTVEYLLRLWSCTTDENIRMSIRGRIKFALTPLALVDLFAILPFYIPMVIPIDLRFIRILRLSRLFRMFKMTRYSRAFRTIGNVIKKSKEELAITLLVMAVLLLLSSSVMYIVERDVQPEVFSSIPAALWWGVATLTTVGYGDVCPITPLGKFIGGIIALLGIGMFALPAGILASGFAEEIQGRRRKKVCPHCGKELE